MKTVIYKVPVTVCRATGLALVLALAASGAGNAQSVVSASFGNAFLTGGDQKARVASLEYAYGLSELLEISADASFAFRDERNDFDLFLGSPEWGVRRHARASVGLVVTPLRFGDDEVQNRVGLFAGPAIRHTNDERIQGRRFFPSDVLAGDPSAVDAFIEDHVGRAYNVYIFDVDGPGAGDGAGTALVTTLPSNQTHVGAELGLRYEVRLKRFVAGVDASMSRYANQDANSESHSWDLVTRVGYRF